MPLQLTDKGKHQTIDKLREVRAAIQSAAGRAGDPDSVENWLELAEGLVDDIEVALCIEWRARLSPDNVYFAGNDDELPF